MSFFFTLFPSHFFSDPFVTFLRPSSSSPASWTWTPSTNWPVESNLKIRNTKSIQQVIYATVISASCDQPSISSTLYASVFRTKANWVSFSLIMFGFVIFGAKILYKKHARKTLMKLTAGVNFINVLHAAFCIQRSQKHKKIRMTWLNFFCFWELWLQSCV